MFDDLDGLLNAPRSLSAIAKFLVYRTSACTAPCFTIFVRPSGRHIVVLYSNECTYHQTFPPFSTVITVVFFTPTAITIFTKFQREPLSVGVKCTGMGKFVNFDQNCRSSRKQYDTGLQIGAMNH